MLPDLPISKTEPLNDWEVQDVLHRMSFELQSLKGQTTRGETALRASHKVLLNFTAALILANEPKPPPSPL